MLKSTHMLLRSLEVHQFRNLTGKIEWSNGLNILYGDNGQGKTNWLEAIYLVATGRSFRTSRLQEAIKFDENLAVVRGVVEQGVETSRELQVTLQGNVKTLSVNGKREAITRYLGQLDIISITADELEIVRGQPEARRRFLDRGVAQLHPSYVQTLLDYGRVLKQKNRLLQDAAEAGKQLSEVKNQLAPWNEQLLDLGHEVHRQRVEFCDRLAGVLQHRFFGREEVEIRYASALEDKGDLTDYRGLFKERLEFRASAELAAGRALIGPHRDDLELRFDGHDLRAFGSSGQQRSALITLDLAALSVYNSYHHEYPLFLYDDVDAELDRGRISSLLEYLDGRTQTFVTTSKQSLVEQFVGRALAHRIEAGLSPSEKADSAPSDTTLNDAIFGD
jgi:DNA replication and repair protein RecF